MTFLLDAGSEFDAPVEAIWSYFTSSADHRAAHHHRDNRLDEISPNQFLASWEQDFDGAPVRFAMRGTVLYPVGLGYEILEGPFQGSKFIIYYTPRGERTGVTVVGEFTSPTLSGARLKQKVRRFFSDEFDQDTDGIQRWSAQRSPASGPTASCPPPRDVREGGTSPSADGTKFLASQEGSGPEAMCAERTEVPNRRPIPGLTAGIVGFDADRPAKGWESRLRLFGQFVGDWVITDRRSFERDGLEARRTGEVHFGWILGGRAVGDVWGAVDRRTGRLIPEGTTIRFYDPRIRAWRSTWLSPRQGVVRRFLGRKERNEIVLREVDVGWRGERWIFSKIGSDSVHWHAIGRKTPRGSWEMREEMVLVRRPKAVEGENGDGRSGGRSDGRFRFAVGETVPPRRATGARPYSTRGAGRDPPQAQA